MRRASARWVNLGVGAIWTLVSVWYFFVCAVPVFAGGPYTEATPHHVLLVGSTVVSPALIAWYAWKGPARDV